LLLALVAVAAMAAEPAAAKKQNRRVGTYRGQIALPHPPVPSSPPTGGTVSFRITKKRNVVGFTATDVPIYLETTVHDPQGGASVSGTYDHRTTFSAPTMPLQGVARFFFTSLLSNPPVGYEGYEVSGKPGAEPGLPSTALKGYVYYQKGNEFIQGDTPYTSFKQLWSATLVGGKKKK